MTCKNEIIKEVKTILFEITENVCIEDYLKRYFSDILVFCIYNFSSLKYINDDVIAYKDPSAKV